MGLFASLTYYFFAVVWLLLLIRESQSGPIINVGHWTVIGLTLKVFVRGQRRRRETRHQACRPKNGWLLFLRVYWVVSEYVWTHLHICECMMFIYLIIISLWPTKASQQIIFSIVKAIKEEGEAQFLANFFWLLTLICLIGLLSDV